ncbi:MAG: hypothetical protein PV344_02100, partial [Anaplasma sp.]|nr:hypothetical protein [Anaplasma sp.]
LFDFELRERTPTATYLFVVDDPDLCAALVALIALAPVAIFLGLGCLTLPTPSVSVLILCCMGLN